MRRGSSLDRGTATVVASAIVTVALAALALTAGAASAPARASAVDPLQDATDTASTTTDTASTTTDTASTTTDTASTTTDTSTTGDVGVVSTSTTGGGGGGGGGGDEPVVGTACAPGTFSATGAAPCRPCPLGSFQSRSGATTCLQAAAGRYVDATGQRQPKLCPVGSYGTVVGAKSQAEGCRPSDRGHYVATTGATSQSKCSAGSFQPEPGQRDCVLASVGSYVPIAGASYQIGCPSATEPGSSVCPGGDEVSGIAALGDRCPPGTWSPTGEADTEAGCIAATPGNHVPNAGATSQTPCRAGSYADAYGATDCTRAEAGFFVPTAGASAALPCPSARVTGATICSESVALTVAGAVLSRYRLPLYLLGGLLVIGGAVLLLYQQGLLNRRTERPAFAGGAWGGFEVNEDLQLVLPQRDAPGQSEDEDRPRTP